MRLEEAQQSRNRSGYADFFLENCNPSICTSNLDTMFEGYPLDELVMYCPTSMKVYHKCKNKTCINPHHLEIVSERAYRIKMSGKEYNREGAGEATCRVCGSAEWRKRPTGGRYCAACNRRLCRERRKGHNK